MSTSDRAPELIIDGTVARCGDCGKVVFGYDDIFTAPPGVRVIDIQDQKLGEHISGDNCLARRKY